MKTIETSKNWCHLLEKREGIAVHIVVEVDLSRLGRPLLVRACTTSQELGRGRMPAVKRSLSVLEVKAVSAAFHSDPKTQRIQ